MPAYDLEEIDAHWLIKMEYVDGETLAQRLEQGPLPVAEAVRVTREMCAGLAAAHKQGVVHRDLKPHNIMLEGKTGRVVLMDFGIARNATPAGKTAENVSGTPEYMAPEQVRGREVDGRADLYALGCVLYQMIVGKHVFPGLTGMAAALAHVNDSPPALPASVPAPLARVVARLLEKDPARRPASADEVALALTAKPRRLFALVAAAAVIVAVAILAAWLLHNASRSRSARTPKLAVLPFVNRSGDPDQDYFSDGITEEIINKLSHLRGLSVAAYQSVERFKNTKKSPGEIGAALGVEYLLSGSVQRAGDRVRVTTALLIAADGLQVWSDDIEGPLDDIFALQQRIASKTVDALALKLSPHDRSSLTDWGTRNAAAYDEYMRGQTLNTHYKQQGDLDAARAHFEKALALDPQFAPAMAGLAWGEAATHRLFNSDPARLDQADVWAKKALEIDPRLTEARVASAFIRGVRYDYAGCIDVARGLVADEPQKFNGWAMLCWCTAYLEPPQLVEAEQACRRSLEINPENAIGQYHLTRALALQGKLTEAERTLATLEERFPTHALVPQGHFWIHLAGNQPREALADLSHAPGTGFTLAEDVMALAQLGRLDDAFAQLEEAILHGYRDAAELRGSLWFEPLRRDPRFDPLLAKHRLTR